MIPVDIFGRFQDSLCVVVCFRHSGRLENGQPAGRRMLRGAAYGLLYLLTRLSPEDVDEARKLSAVVDSAPHDRSESRPGEI